MKKYTLLFSVLFLATFANAQTFYTTVKVSISHKNNSIKHKMLIDTGSDVNHPLYNKTENIENGGIKIKESDTQFTMLNNEVDMLNFLENNKWNLVSVNEVMIIENKFLQYLFKNE